MQPLHYDLRCPAAKDNSIMHAAAAPSNPDAAIVYNAILRYWTAKHNRTIATAWEIAPPKPDLGAKAKKKILKHFWKGIFKGKSPASKLRKSADKSLSQPWCSHSITIYDVQLQKTIVLCMQPQHQANLTQPLYTMRYRDIELQDTIELRAMMWEIALPKPDLGAKAKKHDCEALFKRNLKGKSPAPKLRKSADKALSQPRCSHSTMIYNAQLQKTIALRMQPRPQATLTQPLQCDIEILNYKAQ